jgi:pimeloyl-ACP methyl ester carboxylesterase
MDLDTIAAERSKFTAPLLLVHGLWCTSAIWHRFMGYMAHLGWDCHALRRDNVDPRPSRGEGLERRIDRLRTVVAGFPAPPVVIGHDLGGLVALSERVGPTRAIVALAPLAPPSLAADRIPGLGGPRAILSMRIRDQVPPPSGWRGKAHFGTHMPASTVAEPAALGRDLLDRSCRFAFASTTPTLIVVGTRDRVTARPAAHRMREATAGDLHEVDGDHAIPWSDGWQDRVTAIHRWLIRRLGDSLLIEPEEDSE